MPFELALICAVPTDPEDINAVATPTEFVKASNDRLLFVNFPRVVLNVTFTPLVTVFPKTSNNVAVIVEADRLSAGLDAGLAVNRISAVGPGPIKLTKTGFVVNPLVVALIAAVPTTGEYKSTVAKPEPFVETVIVVRLFEKCASPAGVVVKTTETPGDDRDLSNWSYNCAVIVAGV